jgi:starch synthase
MALLDAVRRALMRYNDKETWRKIVQAAMAQDFSWAHSARRYREIYAGMRSSPR